MDPGIVALACYQCMLDWSTPEELQSHARSVHATLKESKDGFKNSGSSSSSSICSDADDDWAKLDSVIGRLDECERTRTIPSDLTLPRDAIEALVCCMQQRLDALAPPIRFLFDWDSSSSSSDDVKDDSEHGIIVSQAARRRRGFYYACVLQFVRDHLDNAHRETVHAMGQK